MSWALLVIGVSWYAWQEIIYCGWRGKQENDGALVPKGGDMSGSEVAQVYTYIQMWRVEDLHPAGNATGGVGRK